VAKDSVNTCRIARAARNRCWSKSRAQWRRGFGHRAKAARTDFRRDPRGVQGKGPETGQPLRSKAIRMDSCAETWRGLSWNRVGLDRTAANGSEPGRNSSCSSPESPRCSRGRSRRCGQLDAKYVGHLRKELRSYFVSPVAYLLLAMFAIISGFSSELAGLLVYMVSNPNARPIVSMSVNEELIRPLCPTSTWLDFFHPMITMRLFAEEKRQGTIELLATSPIRDIE